MVRSIRIICGGVVVRERFPLHKLVDVSTHPYEFLDAKPNKAILTIGDNVDCVALKCVLKEVERPGSQLMIPVGNSLKHAINNYQAATVLGISDQAAYDNVERTLNAFIEARPIPSYSALTQFTTRLQSGDPFFQKMAEKLANARYKRTIPDVHVFEEYLHRHQNLNDAMGKIDEAKSAARRERQAVAAQNRQTALIRKHTEFKDTRKLVKIPKEKGQEQNTRAPALGLTRSLTQQQHDRLRQLFHFD